MSQPESVTFRPVGVQEPNRLKAKWNSARSRDTARTVIGRDARLDMFRGIALVMIFINHVPGTAYESFTSRNFGFSDAAEAFVFMSGLAAGLAYSNRFRTGHPWAALTKVWARARQLYFVHIVITMLCLAIFAAGAKWFDLGEVLTKNNIAPLFHQPLSVFVGVPLLTHQLGYLNILPLYMMLLLATPFILMAGLRHPRLIFAASVTLWVLAGQFRLNFPNFPNSGGWFFNPLSWQLLFVTGLLSGAAMKVGERFVNYNPALFRAAASFLVIVLLWVKFPVIADVGHKSLSALSKAGAPFYITGFDKTFLSLPRLLHAFALFYVLGNFPSMRALANSSFAAPFRMLGRQGLAVFATGTVVSMALQVVKTGRQENFLFDGFILSAGVGLMLALAWALTKTQQITRAQTH